AATSRARHRCAEKCRRRKARQRASLPTQEKARFRSWHSKARYRDESRPCTEFPSRSSDEHRFGGRFATTSLSWFHRFILHREIALAPWEAVFVGTAISHRGMNKIPVRRW